MKEIYVKFETVEQILDFVESLNVYECSCWLSDNDKRINAKSIIGIFGMDLSEPLKFEFNGDDQIIQNISPYILEETKDFVMIEREAVDGSRCSGIRRIIDRLYSKWSQWTRESVDGSQSWWGACQCAFHVDSIR